MNVNDLAVQTYCFRAFKENPQVVAAVKECGLSKVELTQLHVNYMDEEERREALAIYNDAGIGIISMGVLTLNNDEAAERPAFEFIKEAGADMLSVSFVPDTFQEAARTAEKLADEYDVKLAIHNHGGRHWLGSSEMLRYIFKSTSDRIGLCLDTAWALDSGENPLKMAEEFRDRLYSVHLKDFDFDSARQPTDTLVGTGNLDLPALLSYLKSSGFDGPVILEYEGDVDNPVPSVKKCTELVKEQWPA